MFGSARKIRVLIASSAIAAYLVMALVGDALHLQHCCEHSELDHLSLARKADVPLAEVCAEHSLGLCAVGGERSSTPLPGDSDQDNRSASCWTCFMLSQVGETTAPHAVLASMVFVGTVGTRCLDLYPVAMRRLFLARGPPSFLLLQS